MGTITARKRSNGATAYTAQIRIKRTGVVIHSEAQTFERKADASAWMRRRETELAEPGAIEAIKTPDPTLAAIIERYLDDLGKIKTIGRTKAFTLKQIAASALGALPARSVDSVQLVAYARQRLAADKVKPATVQNDLVLLSGVFSIAQAAWGYRLDDREMDKAKAVCRQMGYAERAEELTRVPTVEELDRIMAHFQDAARRRPWAVPMLKLVAVAIFTTRRQEEITLLRWDDLNPDDQAILVRNVKHPRKKMGNNLWAKVPDEGWALIHSMPRVDERIFPFTTDAVSAQFTRACDWLGIEDLRFHDLRRAGVTRLFEMGLGIPEVASVSLHKDWNMLRRYTNLKKMGDRYAGWKWLQPAIDQQWTGGRKT